MNKINLFSIIAVLSFAGVQAMDSNKQGSSGFNFEEWSRDQTKRRSEQLLEAIKSGDIQETKALILGGLIDVNVKDTKLFTLGYTPLISAVRSRSPKIVSWLIAAGADVNAAGSRDSATALLFAAGLGQQEIVTMLIAAGADVNVKCDEGKTSLFWAAKNGHQEIARMLIDAMLLTPEQLEQARVRVSAFILSMKKSGLACRDTTHIIAQALLGTSLKKIKEINKEPVLVQINEIEDTAIRKSLIDYINLQ
jgi:ankyrin repeat protein